MSNEDPYFLHTLRECRHPDRRHRMEALEILSKEYRGQVKADILLLLLHRATHHDEQTAILSMMSQLGSRAPVDELTAILRDRADSNPFPRGYVQEVTVFGPLLRGKNATQGTHRPEISPTIGNRRETARSSFKAFEPFCCSLVLCC